MKKALLILIAVSVLAVLGWLSLQLLTDGISVRSSYRRPVKVGILHSLTGTMAISERSVAEATALAIEELNERGGLLGRSIEPISADGRSDLSAFAQEAERLITVERVSVVFGCWTSSSRKTVKPLFEKYDHLLVYPVQYEGLEQSPNIVYTGAAPNQQIIPAVKWCFDNLGKQFFLVGSDYVFPRTASAIIKNQLRVLGGKVVGEAYLPLGSDAVKSVVEQIVAARPEIVLNTINGSTNVAFFRELRAAGVSPQRIPTMSFSIGENELREIGVEKMVGDYASWNYFQSVDTEENEAFVQRFRAKYGPDRVTDDPMEAAYFGVHLWAQAVREAGTDEVRAVRKAIANQMLRAPEGIVYVDGRTNHTWKVVRIGRVRPDGQFEIVWSSGNPIRPVPYPANRSPAEWQEFLDGLYRGWGGRWRSPQGQ